MLAFPKQRVNRESRWRGGDRGFWTGRVRPVARFAERRGGRDGRRRSGPDSRTEGTCQLRYWGIRGHKTNLFGFRVDLGIVFRRMSCLRGCLAVPRCERRRSPRYPGARRSAPRGRAGRGTAAPGRRRRDRVGSGRAGAAARRAGAETIEDHFFGTRSPVMMTRTRGLGASVTRQATGLWRCPTHPHVGY